MSAADHEDPVYRHFVPGEFFLILETLSRDESQQTGTVLNATRSFLSQQVNQFSSLLDPLRRKIDDEYKRKRLSKEQQREALEVVDETEAAAGKIQSSLVTALDNLQDDDVVLVEDRAHVFIQIQEGPLANDERVLACFAGALELQARRERKTEDYTVIGTSLNWLMASSQGNLTSGGPGALPVPPSTSYGEPITRQDWEIVETPGPAVAKRKGSAVVNVYILDTVPPFGQLEAALDRWGKTNELIASLLDSIQPVVETRKPASNGLNPQYYQYAGTTLTLHYYEQEKEDSVFSPPLDYAIEHQLYQMPDHGLFIAGIIHSQAECARLHMFQVLNDYGVGTFRSLLWGMQKVLLAIAAVDRAVLNCSLTYAADADLFASDPELIGQFLLVLHVVLEETINNVTVAWETKQIELLYRALPENTVVTMAAAGNDSGVNTVPAKNPAAFASVHGVGALDSDGERAPYSNYADKPPSDGFLTFGGDANQGGADPDTGILGIYTYEGFPGENAPTNETGWARWAGTSFATAVVAGAYAERFCAGRTVKEAHRDLKKERYQEIPGQPFHLRRGQRRRNRESNQG